MQNTKVVPISLPKDLARSLDREAKAAFMTRSEYVRDMLRRQMGFAKLRVLQQEMSRRAPKAGLRTLEDAVKAVRELRRGDKK